MQNNYALLNVDGVYCYNAVTNTLERLKLDHYTLNPRTGEYTIHGHTTDLAVDVPDTKVAGRFFKSEDDYRKGNDLTEVTYVYRSSILRGAYGVGDYHTDTMVAWTEADGLTGYDADAVEYTIVRDGKGLTARHVSDNVYASRQDYMSKNDYKVEQEDGTTKVVTCAKTLLALTDEQARAVAMIRDAIGTLRSTGAYIVSLTDQGALAVYNKDNVGEMGADYYDEVPEGVEVVTDLGAVIDLAGCYCSDDYKVWMKRK